MPIFEYQCEECGHVTTFLESASKRGDPHACEECGSSDTVKLFSTFAARVGSGAGSTSTACADGSCAVPSCPTGTCPFA
jgi:putative FmdB family regulatory protein